MRIDYLTLADRWGCRLALAIYFRRNPRMKKMWEIIAFFGVICCFLWWIFYGFLYVPKDW
jgi:hypothetical protein